MMLNIVNAPRNTLGTADQSESDLALDNVTTEAADQSERAEGARGKAFGGLSESERVLWVTNQNQKAPSDALITTADRKRKLRKRSQSEWPDKSDQ